MRLPSAVLFLVAWLVPAAVVAQEPVAPGSGAVLRVLDKVSGQSENYDLARSQSFDLGPLRVALRECRYPEDNPSGDAYAYVDVVDTRDAQSVFSGWMIASSPALNAMEHARYDVWVLRCKTS